MVKTWCACSLTKTLAHLFLNKTMIMLWESVFMKC